MKVYLLKRIGRKGKTSLYLVYYMGKGRRKSEFLKLYLYTSPKDHLERKHNKNIWHLAKTIAAQRSLDAQFLQHNMVSPTREKIGLLQYFKMVMAEKTASAGNYGNWQSALKHLQQFLKDNDLPISHVDNLFLENFKAYLINSENARGKRKLAPNSAASYYTKLTVVLKSAFQQRYLKENPAERVKGIKTQETHRPYLSLEEVKRLIQTECEIPDLKSAFIFCCYTGLRFSDVKALTWGQFNFSENTGWQLTYRQQKTKAAEVLPIAFEAIKWLGNFSAKDSKIFPHLYYSSWVNQKLRKWMQKAGISKHATFHTSRHTFATLALSMNTDVYTVSKLLGHKNVKTTQLYTRVVDQKKIEAVHKFSFITNKQVHGKANQHELL